MGEGGGVMLVGMRTAAGFLPYPGTVANGLIPLVPPKHQIPPSFPRRRESSVFEVPRRETKSHWVPACAGTTTIGDWQASRHVQRCGGLSRKREREYASGSLKV
ncbi:protein of unknown function [Cupriavidus taiwanensis]|nr:protein of unknown function [Cupriavidus taiwanensis]